MWVPSCVSGWCLNEVRDTNLQPNFYPFSSFVTDCIEVHICLNGHEFTWYWYSVIFIKLLFARCFLKKYNPNTCLYVCAVCAHLHSWIEEPKAGKSHVFSSLILPCGFPGASTEVIWVSAGMSARVRLCVYADMRVCVGLSVVYSGF